MAVAVPKRQAAPAPPPTRTTPPKRRRKAAPGRRTTPAPARGSRAAAPARAAAAPARRAPAPARRPPQRARPKTRRSPGAGVIPLAGRTAVAVRELPDSGLMIRMTRGRAWIAVLGVLLAGIVALNVMTLSFAASTGGIDAQITALAHENRILENRDAKRSGIGRTRAAGAGLGLSMPSSESIAFADFDRETIAKAATRLAAASP